MVFKYKYERPFDQNYFASESLYLKCRLMLVQGTEKIEGKNTPKQNAKGERKIIEKLKKKM